MAGKAHWSATIEGDSMTEAIALDMACRTSSLPLQLGSAYSIESPWSLVNCQENSVTLQHQEGLRIVVEAVGELPVRWHPPILELRPVIVPDQHHRGQTYRWRYVVRTDMSG
jgi:hypothetical protein